MQFNPFFSLYFAKHKKSLMGIEEEWINKPKVLHAKNYVNLHKNILKKTPSWSRLLHSIFFYTLFLVLFAYDKYFY